jgi:pantetheine-phosphate adenylyltransferase
MGYATYMRVCLGGTFDPLHKGHKALIKKACELAGVDGSIFIGITSGKLIEKKGVVSSFDQRKQMILDFLAVEKIMINIIIKTISDRYGPSITDDFDAIVVSSETSSTAQEINKIRIKNGKKPLKIVQIPFILADDNKPISSTRIKKKEIDENGHLIRSD